MALTEGARAPSAAAPFEFTLDRRETLQRDRNPAPPQSSPLSGRGGVGGGGGLPEGGVLEGEEAGACTRSCQS